MARLGAESAALLGLAELVSEVATDAAAARQLLKRLEGELRRLDVSDAQGGGGGGGGGHTLAADVLCLFAATRVWFLADKDYRSFDSPPLAIDPGLLRLYSKASAERSHMPQPGARPAVKTADRSRDVGESGAGRSSGLLGTCCRGERGGGRAGVFTR